MSGRGFGDDGADSYLAWAGFLIIPSIVGSLIGYWTWPDADTWYKALRKPSWSPPSYFFTHNHSIGWLIAYGLMGFAGWNIWKIGANQTHPAGFGLYFAALAFQFAWPILVLKLRLLSLAPLIDLGQLGTVLGVILIFYTATSSVAWILLPIFFLALFDVFHSFALVQLNPKSKSRGRKSV